MTPAQRLRAKTQKAKNLMKVNVSASSKTILPMTEISSSFPLMKQALDSIRSLLSGKNEQEKIAIKKEKIPEFLPYLENYQASGRNYKNPVLVWITLWLFDIGDVDQAMTYATLAIEQDQLPPSNFSSPLVDMYVRGLVTWAEKKFKANDSAEPYLSQVGELIASQQWPVNELILASRVYSKLAMYAEREERWDDCIRWCTLTMNINPDGHGQKTRLDKARTKLGIKPT
ncbi:phage terminase small subunit [Marinibactrum halimedae]|uniref:Terminase n=1 Tax=Marinibactrum halimedae TaxID=1444977 RepID=A0AA37WLM8_9GAMM|nr:phage terminase small subunit [Marinibactrum halimedae]MCD9458467.1 hypothetical protein [Marinibactrum halimedae]GLS26164.1 hypothetical protein GCM10007877_18790 [Marinibactrum halimedae]